MSQFPGREGSCTAVNAAGLSRRKGSRVLPKLTSFDGFRRMSPTPPPFLRPWFRTVTMHMSSVSQARSHWSASVSRVPEGEIKAKTRSIDRAQVPGHYKESRAAGMTLAAAMQWQISWEQVLVVDLPASNFPAAPPACFLLWRCLAEHS